MQKTQLLGTVVTLDGTTSHDPDGDPLTYHWYGPFPTTTGPTPTVPIPEGQYTISLLVDDGTTRSTAATAALTVIPCFTPIARAKPGKVELTWTHLGGLVRYEVYRAPATDPTLWTKIGETTSTFVTFLDTPVANNTTYVYAVGAITQSFMCYSAVTSARPTASRFPPNAAPVIYSSPILQGTASIITYDVNATDPDEDRLQYHLATAPAGMVIEPLTGLIRWVPP